MAAERKYLLLRGHGNLFVVCAMLIGACGCGKQPSENSAAKDVDRGETAVDVKAEPKTGASTLKQDKPIIRIAGNEQEPLARGKGTIRRVAVIGDSIAHGGRFNHRYPRTLQKLLRQSSPGSVVEPYAVPGETCEKLEERFQAQVLDRRPAYDAVIIQCGTNDLHLSFRPKRIKRSMDSMIQRARLADIRVILLTVGPIWGHPGWTEDKEARRVALNKWIMAHDRVIAVDTASALSEGSPSQLKAEFVHADHLHPNRDGLDEMARVIFRTAFNQTWRKVGPGVGYRVYAPFGDSEVADRRLHVVRIDPREVRPVAVLASRRHGQSRTAAEWCAEAGLAVAINAGMFHKDFLTHAGYLRDRGHVNSAKWITKYQSVLAFGPRAAGLPPVDLIDLDQTGGRDRVEEYATAIQNLRLVKRVRRNVWKPQQRRWSEAAVAADRQGRLLFVFSRSPYSMYRFNQLLLELPLGVVAAQHLEGGPEASLSIHGGDVDLDLMGSFETGFNENDDNSHQWPIPNVLGVPAD